MGKELSPIYMLRVLLLEKANPEYFAKNKKLILGSSLAAQDYVLSGHYYEYDKGRMGLEFKNLPEYVKVHKKYHLPYNPNLLVLSTYSVNPGLVMDLAWSFQRDKLNGIIDERGEILDVNKLSLSEVLQVYHNTSMSGTPITAFRPLNAFQRSELIKQARQNTK